MRWWDVKTAKPKRKFARTKRSNCLSFRTTFGALWRGRRPFHTREDVVMLVSLLSSANRQLSAIKNLLAGLLFIAVAAVVLKLLHY